MLSNTTSCPEVIILKSISTNFTLVRNISKLVSTKPLITLIQRTLKTCLQKLDETVSGKMSY